MQEKQISLTIVVPAFNEENNLALACRGIFSIATLYFENYEVLIIDDASKDKTWEVAQQLAQENKRVRAFRNERNMGLGFNYFFGVDQACCQYVMLIPGDNEVSAESMPGIFSTVGQSDIVVAHIANPRVRPLSRQITSRLFTHSMNLLFGQRLHYYNGINVIRTDLVRKCQRLTNGFAYMAATLTLLLNAGHSYASAGFLVKKRVFGKTKAFRIHNILSVARTILLLWRQIHLRARRGSRFTVSSNQI